MNTARAALAGTLLWMFGCSSTHTGASPSTSAVRSDANPIGLMLALSSQLGPADGEGARNQYHVELYVEIEGETQGVIEGDSNHPAYADMIVGHSFAMEITSPPAVGRPALVGFGFVKPNDKATVPLRTALTRGERLVEVVLHFVARRTDPGGGEIELFTVTLADALLTEATSTLSDITDLRDPHTGNLRQTIELSVSTRITWEHPPSATQGEWDLSS